MLTCVALALYSEGMFGVWYVLVLAWHRHMWLNMIFSIF